MKNTLRKALALLLCFSLCISLIPTSWAEEVQNDPSAEVGTDDITLIGDSCIGKLAARTLEQDQSLDPMPGTITDVLVSGTVATVELSTDRVATLVVAVYQDGRLQMLGSGNATVSAGASSGTVVISIDEMPAYFVAGAYLLDAETMEPISQEYISRYYTKEFQDFLASTTADYDQNLVLNLDENEDTNYVVYSDDTVRVTEQENVNQITDNGDGSYTIRNAEECVRSLKVGDRFSCTTINGTVIVFRVSTISVSGTTVTLTEDKTATLEDIFEYVKIEDVSDGTGGTVDTTEMDVGVSYVGEETTVLNTYESGGEFLFGNNADKVLDAPILNTQVAISKEEQTVTFNSAPARDIDQTLGSKFKFKIENEKASGEITFGVSVNFKFYKSGSWTYRSLKIDFSTKATLEILSIAEFEKEIKLGEPQVPVGASGLKASFPISFVFKANARIAITQEMKMTLGFALDSDYGFINLSSLPTLEGMKLDISGKVYIGFKIEAKISTFFSLAATSISGEVGFEASGKMKGWPFELGSTSKKHECDACIEGSIKAQCGFKVKLSALSDDISRSWTIAEFEWKLADFYYSLTKQVYDWGTCPYISYRVKIHVLRSDASNPAGTPVDGAMVLINYANSEMPALAEDAYPITDDKGIAETFLSSGKYKITTNIGNGLRGEAIITVADFAKDVKLWVDDGLIASGKWGNLDWTLDKSGLLTISGNGQMNSLDPRNQGAQAWRVFCDKIKTIIIEEGVTNISNSAFSGCDALTFATIPGSVTYIDDEAFFGCGRLARITIPAGVNSIGYWAFQGCDNLESITIPSSMTSIDDLAFSACYSLKHVYITDLRSWCAISFGRYVYDDMRLFRFSSNPLFNGADLYLNGEIVRDVIIPDGVSSIGAAFYGYERLNSIIIPDSVSSIGDGTFSGCSNLSSVSIPNSVTSIGMFAFRGCNNLSNMTISNNLKDIGSYAFCGCSGLTRIDIPDGVTRIGDSAFFGCDGITTISIPGSVESIDDEAFFSCAGLSSIIIPEGVEHIGTGTFRGCGNLETISIPSSLTTIGDLAFSDCNSLSKVYINDIRSWCAISFGRYVYDDMRLFRFSSNPLFNGADLYLNGEIVRDVIIPDGVSSIGAAFYGYANLISILIPDGVNCIGDGAFFGCTQLSSVSIPDSVTTVGNFAFRACTGLTSMTIPSGVERIGPYTFCQCSSMQTVTIPTSVEIIDNNAFILCDSLTDIYYSGTEAQWSAIDIGENNEGLTSVTIHYISSTSNAMRLTTAKQADDISTIFAKELDVLSLERTNGVIYAEAMAKFEVSEMTNGSEDRAVFNDLVPGANYVLLVVNDGESETLLEPSNLLYISQLTADETGQISMLYAPRIDSDQKTAFAFGPSTNNLKDSTISLEQRSDGILQVDVIYGALKLINDIDYTYEIETADLTVTVMIKGRGDYAGTIKVEADKLPHTPGIPVLEDDSTATDKSVITVHCSKCGAEISRREFNAVPDFILPAALTTVGNEAFTGGSFIYVKLPENAVSIGWHAFADCPNLAYIYIPALTTQIDEQAFGTIQNLTILGKTGTTAETYAQDHNYAFIAVP